jgi:two-component system LytT family response regulator
VAAFDVKAVDYLLKPFDRERLDRALGRVRDTAPNSEQGSDLAALLSYVRREERYAQRLLADDGGGRSRFVNAGDVLRIEAGSNGAILHCREGRCTVRGTLEAIEGRLDPNRFARIHRSHIVNVDHVAEIHPWFHGDYKIRMRNGEELTWSRRYAAKRNDLLK